MKDICKDIKLDAMSIISPPILATGLYLVIHSFIEVTNLDDLGIV